MPLTIDPIPDADPVASFANDVGIFTNTKAREVPGKLNAIAQALKDHVNSAWLATATAFLNGSVVATLNAALSAIETYVNDKLTDFEANLGNYLGVGAGYSVDAVNGALFTGAIAEGGIVYDTGGLATEVEQGPRKIHTIAYNDDGTVASYTEELDLSGVMVSRSYAFAYDADGLLQSISEA